MKEINISKALEIFGEDAIPVLEEKLKSLEKKIELKTAVLEALNELYLLEFKLFLQEQEIPLSKIDLIEPLYKAVKHKDLFKRKEELQKLNKEIKNIRFAYRHATGETIKDELDIEQAKRYPIENLIKSKIKGNGKIKYTFCPFHEEEHPSFRIYTNTNTYYCFSCKRGGDVIDLVMQLKGLKFKDVVRFLT